MSEEHSMRAYFFGNMYLSSIQQGIQAAHATADLFMRYNQYSKFDMIVREWAKNHKVMILLNGGYMSTVKEIIDVLALCEKRSENTKKYIPYCEFAESEEAMGGMVTTVCAILPEWIYGLASHITTGLYHVNPDMKADELPSLEFARTHETFCFKIRSIPKDLDLQTHVAIVHPGSPIEDYTICLPSEIACLIKYMNNCRLAQ